MERKCASCGKNIVFEEDYYCQKCGKSMCSTCYEENYGMCNDCSSYVVPYQ
ncbi:MAG: hypothetical protein PHE93_04480 [Clostridia bacterium]|nr:hypothetical protein [Clostridia bacterium]